MNEDKLKELLKLAWDAGSEECLDTYYGRDTETFQEWYTKQKLNIHSVMRPALDSSDGGVLLGNEDWVKGVRDWQEDFAHENGNYANKCTKCGELFIGHKRRILCKICG